MGRHMPFMNVIPPGLDFSSLKVDLPEDPVIKEMQQHKPAYGGVSTPKAQDSPKSGGSRTPKGMGESSKCCHLCLLLTLPWLRGQSQPQEFSVLVSFACSAVSAEIADNDTYPRPVRFLPDCQLVSCCLCMSSILPVLHVCLYRHCSKWNTTVYRLLPSRL